MKLNQMWLDGNANQNPKGTTRINKNVIFNKSLGAIINEKGNIIVTSYGTNKQLIGTIVLDDNDVIIFSKTSNSSEIGYLNRFYIVFRC